MGVVVEGDVAPARPDGTCFHCRASVGSEHNAGCVRRTKKVRFMVVTEYETELPEDWDNQRCEFWANDGSWCVDNMFSEMAALEHCACSKTKMTALDQESSDE